MSRSSDKIYIIYSKTTKSIETEICLALPQIYYIQRVSPGLLCVLNFIRQKRVCLHTVVFGEKNGGLRLIDPIFPLFPLVSSTNNGRPVSRSKVHFWPTASDDLMLQTWLQINPNK